MNESLSDSTGSTQFPRVNILGIGVSAVTIQQTLKVIDQWIPMGEKHYICVTPSNSILDGHDHPDLKAIYNHSGLTTPDGMPVVWLLRSSGYAHAERVYGPDLMQAVCVHSIQLGYRHYFYGGAEEVVTKLIKKMKQDFPGLHVAGFEAPPFRDLTPQEDHAMIERIENAHADILWVGLGAPRQDRWMAEHIDRLHVPVLIGVGAAFDFLSGTKPQAPLWMRKSGLEWLFRLAHEPARLWKRYIQLPRFAVLVVLQKIGFIKYTLE